MNITEFLDKAVYMEDFRVIGACLSVRGEEVRTGQAWANTNKPFA